MARASENWVYEDDVASWRRKALELQEKHRKYESERKWKKVPIHKGFKLIEIK